MACRALTDPTSLARLVAELEGTTSSTWRQAAEVCFSQSVEDPGRKRLWIVPLDRNAGANPGLWVRDHRELFNDLIGRGVSYTTIVCAGDHPASAERAKISIRTRRDARRGESSRAGRREVVSREVRAISAPSHLWVDRLRVLDDRGNIDERGRQLLSRLIKARGAPTEIVEPARGLLGQGRRNAKEDARAGKLLTADAAHKYERGDYQGAAEAVERAIRFDRFLTLGDGESLWGLASDAWRLAGNDEKAIRAARRAVSRKPHHRSYDRLTLLLNSVGCHEDAIEAGEEALEQDIRCSYLLFQLGSAYFVADRLAQAEEPLRQALESPDDLDTETIQVANQMIEACARRDTEPRGSADD